MAITVLLDPPRPDPTVHGPGMTLSAQLTRQARSNPDRVAYRFDGRSLSYGELHDDTSRLARVLSDLGVAAGDRVAVLSFNRPEYVVTYLACARMGAVVVPLNFRLTDHELAYQLGHSEATVLVVEDALLDVGNRAAEQAGTGTALVIGDLPDTTDPVAAVSWHRAMAAAEPAYPESPVDEDAPAVIMYTSGTTGSPKGATLSHRNLSIWVAAKTAATGYPADCRRMLIGTALFHIAGLGTMITTLYLGGTGILLPSRAFDPGTTIELLRAERVNVAFFVPAQWETIVAHPAAGDAAFPNLWMAVWGAAPASVGLINRIRVTFPDAQVSTAFGQTEVCATATVLTGADAVARPDSVGRPMPQVEARLVDDDMNDVAPGEVGEIVYRGPTVMLGYWNDPERTAEAFRGGWFHSGDLLRADEDGLLYVVDRKKDMIISGGENVYCAEVENVLSDHPKVGSVAVIGVPHPRWGEVPVAVVVPHNGEAPSDAEIEAYGREWLATYKVPRRVVVVDQLPRNASGKVVKSRLRDVVADTGAT